MNRATTLAAMAFATLCAGCDGSPADPSPTAVVGLTVAEEHFRVSLSSEAQIAIGRVRKQSAENGDGTPPQH